MKVFSFFNHIDIEVDRKFFDLGFTIGYGIFAIELGHIVFKFY